MDGSQKQRRVRRGIPLNQAIRSVRGTMTHYMLERRSAWEGTHMVKGWGGRWSARG